MKLFTNFCSHLSGRDCWNVQINMYGCLVRQVRARHSSYVRSAWAPANGWKSRSCPNSGKAIAQARVSVATRNLKEAGGKHLLRRTETSYKANARVVSVHNNTKPDSYSERAGVNEAEIRWKVDALIWGGLTDTENSCLYEIHGVTLAVRSQPRS